jgi:hypothetical protein
MPPPCNAETVSVPLFLLSRDQTASLITNTHDNGGLHGIRVIAKAAFCPFTGVDRKRPPRPFTAARPA